MKKLLFLLALAPMAVLADGIQEPETPMPPIWIKKQPGTSVVYTETVQESAEPVNLMKVLDPTYQEPEEKSAFIWAPYASIKLGYGRHKGKAGTVFVATPEDNQRSDYHAHTMVMSLAFGVRLDDFRLELEGKTDTSSKDRGMFGDDTMHGKLYTNSLMTNAYYDVPLSDVIRPYIGAGVGLGHIKSNIFGVSKSTTNFAWQLMAGINYDLTEHWKLDLGYNYISYGDLTLAETPDVSLKLKDIEGHQITLGTRYEF